MVDVLLTLATLLEDEKYKHFAFKTLEYNSYDLGRRPIYYPYLLTQSLRYLKGDRIIKSDLANLKENLDRLVKISYPFTLLKSHEESGFMVCGEQSCFANTQNVDELDHIIRKTLGEENG